MMNPEDIKKTHTHKSGIKVMWNNGFNCLKKQNGYIDNFPMYIKQTFSKRKCY